MNVRIKAIGIVAAIFASISAVTYYMMVQILRDTIPDLILRDELLKSNK